MKSLLTAVHFLPLFLTALIAVSCGDGGVPPFRVAYFNSLKGRLFAQKVTVRKKGKKVHLLDKRGQVVRRSGVSLLSSLVKKISRSGVPVALLANSNFLYGTSEAYFTDGRQVISLLEKIGFTGMVLGHREFYFGPDVLRKMGKESLGGEKRYTFISANIVDSRTGKRPGYFKPYKIFRDRHGRSVGVIGFVTRSAITKIPGTLFRNFKYLPPVKVIDSVIGELRKKKVSKIVVMADFNLKVKSGDWKKPESSKNVRKYSIETDLKAILDRKVDLFMIRSKKRVSGIARISPKKGIIARLVAIREGGGCLGLFTFGDSADEDRFRVFDVDSRRTPPDISLAETLYNLRGSLEVIAGKVIGTARHEMSHNTSRESALGNLVSDALRDYCKTDVVLVNSGGIKFGMEAGPITRMDMYNILPYQNMLVGIRLSGADLLSVLENSVTYVGENFKSFGQVSGVRFRYDSRKPAGRRVIRGSVLVGGAPLQYGRMYTLAITAYIARGGDRYSSLRNGIRSGRFRVYRPFFGQNDRNIVESYIERETKRSGSVFRTVSGRVIDIARKK